MATTDAVLLDACSDLLVAYGARPVPPADPSFRFSVGQGVHPAKCPGCHHPRTEHGATGECHRLQSWAEPECTCGREMDAAA